ncbi:MAG TPA: hypothetical protein VHO47_01950 [Candidatus Babeliales bacterium]|nr:hypothetical protein [Candidatus Babeliales bacterium]
MKKGVFWLLGLLIAVPLVGQQATFDGDAVLKKIADAVSEQSDKVSELITNWQTSIESMQADIALLPADSQAGLLKEVSSLQATINQGNTALQTLIADRRAAAEKSVGDTIKQVNAGQLGSAQALRSIQAVIFQLSKALGDGISSFNRTIVPSLNSTQQAVARLVNPIKRSKGSQALIEAQKQEKEHREQVISLVRELSSLSDQLTSARSMARKAIADFGLKGEMPDQTIQKVTRSYRQLLKPLSRAYEANQVKTDFNDKTNLLSATMRELIRFYLTTVSLYLNKAKQQLKIKDKAGYHETMYHLAKVLTGIGKGGGAIVTASGFGAAVKAIAGEVFPTQQDIITKFYDINKTKITMGEFLAAFQDLIATVPAPTEEQLRIAGAYYYEIGTNFSVIDPNQLPALQKTINSDYAFMLILRAAALLKSIVAGKDNNTILNEAINAYGQAAKYFSQANDSANQAQYQAVHDNLVSALKFLDQGKSAENAGNAAQAIAAYQQAVKAFTIANDTVDAQQLNAQMTRLQAQQGRKDGMDQLASFANQSKTQMQNYMAYISTLNQDAEQRTLFEVWLAQLGKIAAEVLQNYSLAIQKLKEMNSPTADMQAAIDVLNALIKLQNMLPSGDKLLASGTLDALNDAQNNYYAAAIQAAQKADAAYNGQSGLAQLIPIYPAAFANETLNQYLSNGQQWNFTTLVQRHIAKLFSSIITDSMDPITAAQFYSAAIAGRSPYLSTQSNDYLKKKLNELAGRKQNIDAITASAQKAEVTARAMSTAQWGALDPQASMYASTADNAWKDALRLYLTAYRLGSLDARQDYLRVLQEYQDAYMKNVPALFYPPMNVAKLAFARYVLHHQANDVQAANESFKQVVDLLKPAFDEMNTALIRVKSPEYIATADEILTDMSGFLSRFDQILADQQNIIAELAPGSNVQDLTVFEKNINTQQNTISVSIGLQGQPAALSITLGNMDALSASVYKAIGDYYFAKKDYTKAASAYYQAQQYFNKINDTNQANAVNAQYKLAYSRSYIDISINSIIPNERDAHSIENVSVAGTTVPARYELLSYGIELPDYIPFSLTTDQINKMAPDALSAFLVNYAFLLFVDKALKAQGMSYSDAFNGVQVRSDIGPDVKTIIMQGYQFVKNLQARIASNKSSLNLVERKNAYGTTVFDLFEKYKPIPVQPIIGFPMTAVPYPAFPTVQGYYAWAQRLANPATPTITAGGQTYVSGNDPEAYNLATKLLAQAYLSAAAIYKKRLDFLMDGGDVSSIDPVMSADEMKNLTAARQDIIKLKSIDKNDMNIKLADFMQTYKLIQDYALNVIALYYSLASQLYDQLGDAERVAAINSAMNGDLYKQLGDLAQLFLVGDPFATEYFYGSQDSYGGVLIDVKDYYLAAVKAYGAKDDRSNRLIEAAGNLFVQAGDILTNQQNYFGSVSLYSFGVGAFKSMVPVDQKKLDAANLKLLQGYYKGSSNNMIQYHTARSAPITITLSTGQQETINLSDLIAKAGNGDTAENDKAQSIKEAFLDALVYYMGGSLVANQLAGSSAVDSSQGGTVDESKDPIALAAKRLVTDYLTQINTSFDSVESIMQWLMSDSFAQTLNGAFDYFSKHILGASDQAERLAGYRALGMWMNRLFYDAFGKVYMQDYLGEVSTNALQLLLQSVKDEEQAIAAPAQQWIG